jgi:hypothetical protein
VNLIPPTQACNHMRLKQYAWRADAEAYEVVCKYCGADGLVTREMLEDRGVGLPGMVENPSLSTRGVKP